jgi:hypothetical protein
MKQCNLSTQIAKKPAMDRESEAILAILGARKALWRVKMALELPHSRLDISAISV